MKHCLISALTAASLALTACADGEAETIETSEPIAAGLDITNAYIAPPFKGRDVAAGFFTLTNNGPDDRLVSAASPIAKSVEIHTHSEVDGVMAMRQLDGIDLPNGVTVEFKPGSYHLMMFGVELADDVTEAPLTLTYASGEDMTLNVPIEGRD